MRIVHWHGPLSPETRKGPAGWAPERGQVDMSAVERCRQMPPGPVRRSQRSRAITCTAPAFTPVTRLTVSATWAASCWVKVSVFTTTWALSPEM